MFRFSSVATAVVTLSLLISAPTGAVTLYDGSAGTPPEAQGWLTYYSLGTSTKTTSGGKTTLDTGSSSTYAGFSNYFPAIPPNAPVIVNPSFPSLSRTNGFALNFTAKLNSESHSTNDRAGLDVILLANDHQGIELGFWSGEIWAQSGPTFTHAEGAAFNTTSALTNYALTIQGSNYSLLANGSPLLSGSIRDYSSFGTPYDVNNFLFIGDDTTSATASFDLSQVSIVPEPMSVVLIAIGALVLRRNNNRAPV
jgi:hypothetical protein